MAQIVMVFYIYFYKFQEISLEILLWMGQVGHYQSPSLTKQSPHQFHSMPIVHISFLNCAVSHSQYLRIH